MVKSLPPTVHAGRSYGKKGYFSQYIAVGVMVGRLFLIVRGGRSYDTSHSTWREAGVTILRTVHGRRQEL